MVDLGTPVEKHTRGTWRPHNRRRRPTNEVIEPEKYNLWISFPYSFNLMFEIIKLSLRPGLNFPVGDAIIG